MHQPASIQMVTLLALLLCQSASLGQSGQSDESIDRPFQRWLPLPTGDQTEFAQQAEMLKQLRDSVFPRANETGDSAPGPELTPQQLKKIDEALEMWRDVAGDQPLPDLSRVPKEWLSALPDQETRNQAQQLLEQYARQRKLPKPDDGAGNTGGVPLPANSKPSDASGKPSGPNRAGNPPNRYRNPATSNNPTGATRPESYTNNATTNNASTNDSVAAGRKNPSGATTENPLTPEKLESLRKLFQELSSAKPQDGTASKSNSSQGNEMRDGRRPSASPGAMPQARPTNPTPSTANPPFVPRSSNDRRVTQPLAQQPSSSNGLPPRQDQLRGEPSARSSFSDAKPELVPNAPASPDPSRSASRGDGLERSNPFENPFPNSTAQPDLGFDPFSERPEPSTSTRPGSQNGLNRGIQGSNTAPSAPPRSSEAGGGRPSRDSNAAKPDVRSQVERWGLGATLRGIVERTLKEQGAEEDPSSIIQSLQELANKKSNRSSTQQSPTTEPPLTSNATQANRPSNSKSQGLGSAVQPANSPSPINSTANKRSANTAASGSSSSESFSELAGDFWKAVSSPPSREPFSGGSSSEASGSNSSSGSWSFRVGWQQWAILIGALGVCALLLYLARNRLLPLEPAAVDAREVAIMLKTGINDRADIVRVFHRCVLGRPYSAASWWTHNFVAQRIRAATPDLSDPLGDLIRVYEHARYLPANVELSSEQLQQARAALQRLATPNA